MRATKRQEAERVWMLMQQFVEAHSRHTAMAEALGFSLGAGRGRVLSQLQDGPLTLTGLAERTGFDAPYTTTVVDKLETHGLVARRPHPEDRRRKLVALTPAGHAALATVADLRREPPAPLAAATAAELAQLGGLLAALVDPAQPARLRKTGE